MRLLSSGIGLGLLLFGAIEAPHYRINTTDSLPRGLYRETTEPLSNGAIVTECLPFEWVTLAKERDYLGEGNCPGHVRSVIKQVVGIEGDTIELDEAFVAVNGALILNSETRETDSKGRPLPAYPRGTFVLQPGEVFLLATHSERSWDGRYMGPTQRSSITGTWKPVWTEE